eukprot:2271804-Rhodomonas_salina.3
MAVPDMSYLVLCFCLNEDPEAGSTIACLSTAQHIVWPATVLDVVKGWCLPLPGVAKYGLR